MVVSTKFINFYLTLHILHNIDFGMWNYLWKLGFWDSSYENWTIFKINLLNPLDEMGLRGIPKVDGMKSL